ncbi:YhcN/YlaJ family sporulation lipoprotein [Brevibacillus laterosporus]|uniref:YhcN/YlaJ family sporulation lipoprotein n=1 Tax=Brevibacillus laterosporus TaxID=1465 RepID=UPI001EF3A5BD|nr:YhcN/YlaJ family sporulation lipoprotein [Brevibacillus laterosporus]MCG7319492.1 YhcN/YlaJ family sporulation lipoprotein [Brevibacillus laterosporus]
MQKKWIFATVASLALLTSACGTTPGGGTAQTKSYSTSAYTNRMNYGTSTNNYDYEGFGYRNNAGRPTFFYGSQPNYNDYLRNGRTSAYRATPYGTTAPSSMYNPNAYSSSGYPYSGRTLTKGASLYSNESYGQSYRMNGVGIYNAYGSPNSTQSYPYYNAMNGTGAPSIYSTYNTSYGQNANTTGYAVVQRNQLRGYEKTPRVYIDRDALAQAVGQVVCSVPGIDNATVLVTDEEIFVGVKTSDKDDHSATVKARNSALSISPRYYKVYLTNDQNMTKELSHVANSSAKTASTQSTSGTTHVQTVDRLVKSFGGMTDYEKTKSMMNKTQSRTR